MVSAVALLLVLAGACGGTGGQVARTGTKVVVSRFVSAADDAAEYELIWGRQPSQGLLSRDRALLQSLDDSVVRVAPRADATAAETFVDYYQRSADDVITLTGHNEAGIFRFPDGSWVDIGALGSGGPPIAIISCESAKYASGQAVGLPSVLTLTVAADIERTFVQRVSDLNAAPSVAQLKRLLEDSADEMTDGQEGTWIAVAVVGGTSATVVTLLVWQIEPAA